MSFSFIFKIAKEMGGRIEMVELGC